MKRREFIAGLGGAAAWPLVARAQQGDRVRRIGMLMAFDENDPAGKAFLSAFAQGLSTLGWSDGRNVRLEVRWAGENLERMRLFAKELVGLQPDLILADTTPVTAVVQRETRTIPIVFVVVSDPVGSGFVAGLPRPGGNITGFSSNYETLAGKWLELLTQIVPGVRRAAFIYNPDTAPYVPSYYMPSFEAAARSFKVTPIVAPARSEVEIEAIIASLGQEPRGGLVGLADNFMFVHRALIVSLAARNNVPGVYYDSFFVREGGLLSYGPDFVDVFRRAASYVDRILHGARPEDLPVQLPVKYEMAVNLKTAKAIGVTIPETLLARADEVIE
jgi:putative tryptophan/tyrosine transport system substrate-binding protein